MPERIEINFVRGERVYVLVQPKASQPRGDVRHDDYLAMLNISYPFSDAQPQTRNSRRVAKRLFVVDSVTFEPPTGWKQMSDNEHLWISRLKQWLADKKIDRREFIRYSTLLGMSASAAYMWA